MLHGQQAPCKTAVSSDACHTDLSLPQWHVAEAVKAALLSIACHVAVLMQEQQARRAEAAKALVNASGLGSAALSQLLDSTATELMSEHSIKLKGKTGSVRNQQRGRASHHSMDMQAEDMQGMQHDASEAAPAPDAGLAAGKSESQAAQGRASAPAPKAADLLDSLGNWGL